MTHGQGLSSSEAPVPPIDRVAPRSEKVSALCLPCTALRCFRLFAYRLGCAFRLFPLQGLYQARPYALFRFIRGHTGPGTPGTAAPSPGAAFGGGILRLDLRLVESSCAPKSGNVIPSGRGESGTHGYFQHPLSQTIAAGCAESFARSSSYFHADRGDERGTGGRNPREEGIIRRNIFLGVRVVGFEAFMNQCLCSLLAFDFDNRAFCNWPRGSRLAVLGTRMPRRRQPPRKA